MVFRVLSAAVFCALIACTVAQVSFLNDEDPTCPYPQIEMQQSLKPNRPATKSFLGQRVKETKLNLFGGAYGVRGWSGQVEVFKRTDGEYEHMQTLVPADKQTGAYFGLNLDSKGLLLTVSAPFRKTFGNKSGAFYIFKRDKVSGMWSQSQKMKPDVGHPGMYFGYSTAIAGKKQLVAGARRQDNHNNGELKRGAVYVYRKSDGVFKNIQVIWGFGGQFGDEVVVNQETLLVGAPREDGKGAAYVYKKQEDHTYKFLQRLFPQIPAGVPNETKVHIGEGLAISPTKKYIILGGETAYSFNGRTGAAYMWVLGGDGRYRFKQPMYPRSKTHNQKFGQRITFADNLVAIGAWKDENEGKERGAVSLWHKCNDGTFRERTVLKLKKSYEGDELGKHVDISQGHILAGCPKRDEEARLSTKSDEGKIYAWTFSIVCPTGSCPAVE